MRAIFVERPGGPEALVLKDLERPRPGRGEVLIRLRASGVNFADILCRTGNHPGMPQPPLVPGCEGSGTVEEVSETVTAFRPGDRVAVYSPPGGTYAEWMIAPEHRVLPMPDSMPFESAAGFTHVFLTAYHALRTIGRARKGEWIALTAAAGGVGTAMLQVARAWGLKIIAGAGSDEKLELLEKWGVAYRVNYRSQSLRRFVRDATDGRGADLILDSVGGEVFREALGALAPLGRLVLFGMASGEPVAVQPFELLPTSSTFATLNLSVLFARTPDLIQSSWRDLLQLYACGAVQAFISRRLPLEHAAEAHRLLESRTTVGKLILLPDAGDR